MPDKPAAYTIKVKVQRWDLPIPKEAALWYIVILLRQFSGNSEFSRELLPSALFGEEHTRPHSDRKTF